MTRATGGTETGLPPEHSLARQDKVSLSELAYDVLATTPADLFPAWALSQRQALETVGISPPTIDLIDTDLPAARWCDQPEVDWILLIGSLAATHTELPVQRADYTAG